MHTKKGDNKVLIHIEGCLELQSLEIVLVNYFMWIYMKQLTTILQIVTLDLGNEET